MLDGEGSSIDVMESRNIEMVTDMGLQGMEYFLSFLEGNSGDASTKLRDFKNKVIIKTKSVTI